MYGQQDAQTAMPVAAALIRQLGFTTIQEPGRRIVAEEMAGPGDALPWVHMKAFARRAIEVAISDLEAAQFLNDIVFFDRGMIDAAVALAHSGGPTIQEILGETLIYERRVYIVPPWRQLFAEDAERRHSFYAAVQEHHRIEQALDSFGYLRTEPPKVAVQERAEIVLKECGVL